jgi:hypothetical protein
METKKIDLDLNIEKPVKIEISRGSVFIKSDSENAFVELEYSPFGNIKPEINLKSNEKNNIAFKNSEIVKTNTIFHLPSVIKDIEVHVLDGDILAENLNCNIDLQSDSGDIQVKKCNGILKCTGFNGGININSISGEVNLNAVNGAVKINDWDNASGNIQSENGKITIGLKKASEELIVNSKNGKISLGLSKKNPCTIIARGKDVIKYIDDLVKGDHLGSPAKFEWEGGGKQIQLFSSTNKVVVTTIENLSEISPDFESIFNEFEETIKENFNFDSLAENFKEFGKKMEKWGKEFAKNFQKTFSDIDKKNKSKDNNNSSERMEILNMLKEGKITADEAEKLLNALK